MPDPSNYKHYAVSILFWWTQHGWPWQRTEWFYYHRTTVKSSVYKVPVLLVSNAIVQIGVSSQRLPLRRGAVWLLYRVFVCCCHVGWLQECPFSCLSFTLGSCLECIGSGLCCTDIKILLTPARIKGFKNAVCILLSEQEMVRWYSVVREDD